MLSRSAVTNFVFVGELKSELPFREGSDEIRLPLTTGLAGHVATTGEPLKIDSVAKDSRYVRYGQEMGQPMHVLVYFCVMSNRLFREREAMKFTVIYTCQAGHATMLGEPLEIDVAAKDSRISFV